MVAAFASRLNRMRRVTRVTSRQEMAAVLFLGTIVVQSLHWLEHLIQVVQRSVLNDPHGVGLLGFIFDFEWVHFLYNGIFLILLYFFYFGLGLRLIPPCARRRVVLTLLGLAVLVQNYHFIEHIIRLNQFLGTGQDEPPGILGQVFNGVWVHFFLNGLAVAPLFPAFILGQFHHKLPRARIKQNK